MRLFVAVKLPEQEKERIAGELLEKIPRKHFKAVEKGNLHITLCFIGEAPEEHAQEIREALSKVQFTPFRAVLSGIGSFGSRVLWLGLSVGEKECEALAEKVHQALGIKSGMKFHAHVTLARGRDAGKGETEKTAEKLGKAGFEGVEFEVDGFALMQSKSGPAGPAYIVGSWFSASTFLSKESGS